MKRCQMLHEKFTDDEFRQIVTDSSSISDLMRRLGYSSESSYAKQVSGRCRRLGIKVAKKTWCRYSDEQLKNAAKNAKSVSEVMRNLGATTINGFAHARWSKRLISLGIKFVEAAAWNRGLSLPKRDINDYLVLNGPEITPCKLKRKLIKAGLKKNECEWCGLTHWRGVKLKLHLDHIDGNKKDNRLTNLRILCPNCHSITPTYAKMKSKSPGCGEKADATDLSVGSPIEKSLGSMLLNSVNPEMAIPSQASQEEGVETKQELPKVDNNYGEDIVQTTN